MMFKKFANSRIKEIQKSVADSCGISVEQMISVSRDRKMAYPRHLAMWLCRNLIGVPFIEIGGAFGGRDHSTVIKGIQNCEKFCTGEDAWKKKRQSLIERFERKHPA